MTLMLEHPLGDAVLRARADRTGTGNEDDLTVVQVRETGGAAPYREVLEVDDPVAGGWRSEYPWREAGRVARLFNEGRWTRRMLVGSRYRLKEAE